MSVADTTTSVFIVRIWHEPRESEAREMIWRGKVEHLGTKEDAYFRDMATLVEFLIGQAGLRNGRD